MIGMRRGRRAAPGHRVKVGLAAVALTGAAGLIAACGSSSPGSARPVSASGPAVTIEARNLSGVGTVLTDGRGYALYMFEPDAQRQVTCTGLCAATWPPVTISARASLVAGSGVQQSLLSSDPDPAGGRVVTYDDWPLYTYTGDVQPGQDTGQGIDLNGGLWYLLRPSGKPLIGGPGG
jgi:predicted lipoprotein with Yx(FWY)xxD motif